STGGVLSAVTKSGSNEFHGSIFGNYTPGALQGSRPAINTAASVFATNGLDEFGVPNRVWNSGDFGVELGGPILKDRLWFYAGFSPSIARNVYTRTTNRILLGADGTPLLDNQGNQQAVEIPGTAQRRFADTRAYNYIAKLTFLLSPNQNIALSVSGAPKTSDQPAFNPGLLSGTREYNDNLDLSLKYTARCLGKHLL